MGVLERLGNLRVERVQLVVGPRDEEAMVGGGIIAIISWCGVALLLCLIGGGGTQLSHRFAHTGPQVYRGIVVTARTGGWHILVPLLVEVGFDAVIVPEVAAGFHEGIRVIECDGGSAKVAGLINGRDGGVRMCVNVFKVVRPSTRVGAQAAW